MFIHCIVHNLVDQVIQSFARNTSDIHSRSFSYRLKPFENGNTALVIAACLCHFFFPFPAKSITFYNEFLFLIRILTSRILHMRNNHQRKFKCHRIVKFTDIKPDDLFQTLQTVHQGISVHIKLSGSL